MTYEHFPQSATKYLEEAIKQDPDYDAADLHKAVGIQLPYCQQKADEVKANCLAEAKELSDGEENLEDVIHFMQTERGYSEISARHFILQCATPTVEE